MPNFKRIIIKEEWVLLTNNIYQAILLEHFISIDSDHLWISKKSEDLSKDCLLDLSKQTIRKHLKMMIDSELIFERNDPNSVWNKTMQYKINYPKINAFLSEHTNTEKQDNSLETTLFEDLTSKNKSSFSDSSLFEEAKPIKEIRLSPPSSSHESQDSIFGTSNDESLFTKSNQASNTNSYSNNDFNKKTKTNDHNSSSLFKTSSSDLDFDNDYYNKSKERLKKAFQRNNKK